MIYGIQQWREVACGIEVADVTLALSSWSRERRLVVVRQHVRMRPQASGKQP